MINLNSKGQSFAVFKLLIGAIVALAILSIIVGIISYFDNIKIQISEKRMIDSLVSAANAPEQVVKAEKLSFNKGASYSKKVFGNAVNISEECISFDADGSAFDNSSGNAVIIVNNSQADVFVKCVPSTDASFNVSCTGQLSCNISFGKQLS